MAWTTWRDTAKPIIRDVIRENSGADPKVVRRALRKAYPWGERSMWPYRVWCDEVRKQLGLKPVKKDENQLELF